MANGGQGGPLPSTTQQPVQNWHQPQGQPGMQQRPDMDGGRFGGQFGHPGMMQPQAGKGPGQPQVMPMQQPGQYPTAFVPSVNPMVNPTNPGIPLAPTGLGQLPPQGLASLPPAAGTYPSRTV